MQNKLIAIVAATGLYAGCINQLGARPGADGDGGYTPTNPTMDMSPPATAYDAPLRRLSKTEYKSSVLAVLNYDPTFTSEYNDRVNAFVGSDIDAACDSLITEDESAIFSNNASILVMSDVLGREYLDVGFSVAHSWIYRRAVKNGTVFKDYEYGGVTDAVLSGWMNCTGLLGTTTTTVTDACVQAFIPAFARLAYRRALTSDEVTALFTLYKAQPASSKSDAMVTLIQRVLTSAFFIYRPEFGDSSKGDATKVPLSTDELATRLSYALWNSPPTAALTTYIATHPIDSADGVKAVATWMLDKTANPGAAQATITQFHYELLHLSQLILQTPSKFQNIAGTLANYGDIDSTTMQPKQDTVGFSTVEPYLLQETEMLVNDALLGSGDGSLDALMTTNKTFLNAKLAAYYNYSAQFAAQNPTASTASDADENEFFPFTYPKAADAAGQARAGILTQGSLMSIYAHPNLRSPTRRGVFVLERLLCVDLPPVPQNVSTAIPASTTAAPKTLRESLELVHATDPSCASCHNLMDPIGFAFENFNQFGQWRATEYEPYTTGPTLDASGNITTPITASFNNAVDLATDLASNAALAQCFTKQWFRYTHGRNETDADKAELDAVGTVFQSGGRKIKDLLVAWVTSDSFRYRTPVVPGGNQ